MQPEQYTAIRRKEAEAVAAAKTSEERDRKEFARLKEKYEN
jgi:hypothetical protein